MTITFLIYGWRGVSAAAAAEEHAADAMPRQRDRRGARDGVSACFLFWK
jgi:hypothetical protein